MATTTNFGWETPDDTDLVKDGAAAIRTLGQSIDTSMADLEGGTTGQVLSKASNADMDFIWVTSDDANAIQNAIVDAKGDLIAATAADTPARLAVGTDGQVLTADSTAATGIKWATASSGSMTLISSGSLTGTSVTVSPIAGTYKQLIVKMFNGYGATSGYFPSLRFNGDTGATQYYCGAFKMPSATGLGVGPSSYGAVAESSQNSSSYYLANYTVIPNYTSTTSYKICTLNFLARGASDFHTGSGTMYWKSTSAITSITMINEGGGTTWAGGTYEIWGVN